MTDVAIVGAGLAGLAAAHELAKAGRKVRVFEAQPYLGGRTASWDDNGMIVESGLHRVPGFYRHLPQLMEECRIDLSRALIWEDEVEIRVPDGPRAVYAASLPRRPFQTIGSLLGPGALCSPGERATLAAFFSAGLAHYATRPDTLDAISVRDYAKRYGVSDRAIARILIPLTEGLFFLPPERYSAYVLFGLLAQGALGAHRSGLAAFAGGMTAIVADPIAGRIRELGGTVETNAAVEALIVADGAVRGVKVGGETVRAADVVLAASLAPAQALVEGAFGRQAWNETMLRLPTMPAATLQMELDEPCAPVDRMTFAPGTAMTTFTEQSRTTFRHAPGRVSIILSEPERRLAMRPDEILAEVCADARRVGIVFEGAIRQWRIVNRRDDFYALTPGTEKLRPAQKTPVPGLTLAGDYTRQKYLATMEGAVLSGTEAAALVLGKR